LATVFATAREAGQFGVFVQLLMLTGQRKGEIAGLRAEMIDRAAQTVTLPAAMVKNKREHAFPYGAMAAALIESLPKEGPLFPGRQSANGHPPTEATAFNGFSNATTAFRVRCGIDHWTLHDLRRTLATGMARLAIPPHCIEALLNHVVGSLSAVAHIYNRHSYLPEARAAIGVWEKHIASLPIT
jgi:integrase